MRLLNLVGKQPIITPQHPGDGIFKFFITQTRGRGRLVFGLHKIFMSQTSFLLIHICFPFYSGEKHEES